MEEDVFGIGQFNIIEDRENYYSFRAFNNADNKDIEDGIIWQRPLDEDSKTLLLQQLGRCIYAIDEE